MNVLKTRLREFSAKTMTRWSALVCVAICLSSCAVMGRRHIDHPLEAETVDRIEVNMDRKEVVEILGAPQEILFSNLEHDPLREHAYIYEYQVDAGTAIFFGVVNFGRLDSKKDRVVVFFDDAGKVSHVGASLHSQESGFGFPFGK